MSTMTTPRLYGLVLAGGQSRRMGRDKGLLEYHGQPHREYLYALLARYCERVFLSLNPTQSQPDAAYFNLILDTPNYADTGPVGAVVNMVEQHPNVALFVVTCDLPFFDASCAEQLLAARDPARAATAFLNPDINQAEPLVTIYEAAFLRGVPAQFKAGVNSLRKLLAKADVKLITQHTGRCIHSADLPDEFSAANRAMQSHKPSDAPLA